MTFKIIINCGPCRDFIGRCLASVRAQTFAHWDAYVTVDPCGDDTSVRAVLAAASDPRIHVRVNHDAALLDGQPRRPPSAGATPRPKT